MADSSKARDSVNVDADILKEFRDLVYATRGTLYGKLKEEATAALKAHSAKLRKELESRAPPPGGD